MLQRIYNILYEFRAYALLSLLIIISLILMTTNDTPQIKQIRAVSTVIFGLMQEPLSFIPTYLGLKSENELIRHTNTELNDEVQQLREAKLENIRLRQLLAIKDQLHYKLVPLRVINKNLTMLRNTLTLNGGSADGISPQMPVVSDGGLVGIVTAVTNHFSSVNILTNTDFKASAKIQRSRVDGIIAWDGKVLSLKNVPKTRDVKIGDVVITSEYSNTYPPNIRIGLVSEVQDRGNMLFKSIIVTPGIDLIKLEEAFVVQYIPSRERAELEQHTAIHPPK
jgi:rod shape-determining protein MreC